MKRTIIVGAIVTFAVALTGWAGDETTFDYFANKGRRYKNEKNEQTGRKTVNGPDGNCMFRQYEGLARISILRFSEKSK